MANFVLRSAVWIVAIAAWLRLRWPHDGHPELSWGPQSILAAILVAAALVGFVWSATALAAKVPDAINAPTTLLTRGPFAYVRNPLYLSAACLFIGLTTVFGLWERSDVIVVPLFGVLVHLFVVYWEEPKTRARLGQPYDVYRATVPRWVPRPPSHPS